MQSYAVGETGVKQVDRGGQTARGGERVGRRGLAVSQGPRHTQAVAAWGEGRGDWSRREGRGMPVFGPPDEHGRVCGEGALDGSGLASRLFPRTSSATPDVTNKEEGEGPRKPL